MIERVADRLRFETDRTVTVLSGKVELGQGLSDALTLICSEELALEPDRIRVRYGDTEATPDDGLTAGSGSMERAGAAVRDAARAARNELLRRASERLEVPVDRLEACSGAIRPCAGDAAGEPAPAPDRHEAATVEEHPPRDNGGSTPAAGSPTAGSGIDYWDLLDSEEFGDGQTAWRHPAAAVGMAAADGDRENPSQATTGWASSAAEADARPAGRSSLRTPPAQRPPTTAPQPEARATVRFPAQADVSPAAPSANRDTAPGALPNRSFAAGRQGSWRRVDRVVRGAGNFVHDLRLPGMVHGRVLRPPGYGQRLAALAADAARAMRGVLAVVVDGSFVAVAAEREEQANAAHGVLAASARWQPQADGNLPADGRADPRTAPRRAPAAATPLPRHRATPPGLPADGRTALREAPAETIPILHRGSTPPGVPATTVSAAYSRPFLMHAALGPSAAAAHLERDGRLTVWSHTQGPFELRAALAEALQRAPESIRVIHVDGSGCYGHNGADDVALDAALLALAVPERPVLIKWTRADENRWEPFGTAMIVTCSAELDTTGAVLSWRHEARSHAHGTRPRGTPGHSTLLAAWHRAAPLTPPAPRNGSGLTAGPQRNAEPLYHFPEVAIATHFVPEAPLRVSALRSLGAFANVFAIESFMDELAARAGEDPLAYRLRHLRDDRAIRVLTEAVRAAPAAGAKGARDTGGALVGRGIAVARYKNLQACVAVVCDVAVDPGSGEIRLLHATIAADAGRIIDRDGLANQLEGGFLQAASWTLKEQARGDRAAIRSTDWDTYPVLRFSEVPPVTARLIDRPDLPSVGAGEAAQGPTPAAIANAVYAAAGIRLRHTPFTPARVMAALSGV